MQLEDVCRSVPTYLMFTFSFPLLANVETDDIFCDSSIYTLEEDEQIFRRLLRWCFALFIFLATHQNKYLLPIRFTSVIHWNTRLWLRRVRNYFLIKLDDKNAETFDNKPNASTLWNTLRKSSENYKQIENFHRASSRKRQHKQGKKFEIAKTKINDETIITLAVVNLTISEERKRSSAVLRQHHMIHMKCFCLLVLMYVSSYYALFLRRTVNMVQQFLEHIQQ